MKIGILLISAAFAQLALAQKATVKATPKVSISQHTTGDNSPAVGVMSGDAKIVNAPKAQPPAAAHTEPCALPTCKPVPSEYQISLLKAHDAYVQAQSNLNQANASMLSTPAGASIIIAKSQLDDAGKNLGDEIERIKKALGCQEVAGEDIRCIMAPPPPPPSPPASPPATPSNP